MDDLIAIVPPGYGPDSCQPIDTKGLARLRCGPNSLPGGPKQAVYGLYQSPQATANSFQAFYDNDLKDIHASCPGGKSTNPAYIQTPDGTQLGAYACGDAPPTVIWVVNVPKFAGWAEGDNLEDLFKWWKTVLPAQVKGQG